MKRTCYALILVLFSISLLCFWGCKQQANKEVFTFKLGHVANTDHTWHKAFEYFRDIVYERSQGKIIIKVFPNEQLGKELELIRSIKTGIADMTITGGSLQNWTDIVAFSDMPFVFRDSLHMQKLADGPLGKKMELRILEETGIRCLTYFQRGPRHLTSNRPIRKPDDLKGLIVRVPSVPTYTSAWSALGANPTPMALSEVFTSLQQGTIEGQENPLAMISSTNLYEVQDYVNLTAHVISWGYVVIGDKHFQKMPFDLQEIFMSAIKEMQDFEHRLFLENEARLREYLESKGMEFIKVDQADFRQKGAEAVYQSLSEDMKEMYNQIGDIK
ncbi:MAG: TRAP transporter substrate-binding protein [Bacteroidetes bacterium]|nr:TRAP transporter substrate-binding protein [Bacteroidota bacterium]